MKKRLLIVMLFGLFWLAGCGSAPSTPQDSPIPASATAMPIPSTATPMPSARPTHTPTPTDDPRFATIEEAVKEVTARPRPQDPPVPATIGLKIYLGGDVQTGDESRAALLLVPENTIVRIGANTHFVLQERIPGKHETTLRMLLGKLWIILKGGILNIETPSGTAAVRGSLMSVGYDATGKMQVSCLEGHCSVQSTTGITVDLTGGQAVNILAAGEAPTAPFPIPREELDEWLKIAPDEASSHLPPTPSAIPTALPTIPPIPSAIPPTPQPTAYNLINNCNEIWHWRFSGPTPLTLDIPPYNTASGVLLGGTYTAIDWVGETGEQHATGPITPGGYITATACQ